MSEIVVKGRLIEPDLVQLDEPLHGAVPVVEVFVRAQPTTEAPGQSLETLLTRLLQRPPGTRTREDIMAQINEERDSWGDR